MTTVCGVARFKDVSWYLNLLYHHTFSSEGELYKTLLVGEIEGRSWEKTRYEACCTSVSSIQKPSIPHHSPTDREVNPPLILSDLTKMADVINSVAIHTTTKVSSSLSFSQDVIPA